MEEESDIEITQDQYVNIIYNIGTKINKYLDTNKKSLKEAFGDKIKDLSGEEVPEKDRIEIIAIEDFIEKMKEFGITINTEIEIYCLFSRYKITDDYGIKQYLETTTSTYKYVIDKTLKWRIRDMLDQMNINVQ